MNMEESLVVVKEMERVTLEMEVEINNEITETASGGLLVREVLASKADCCYTSHEMV